MSDELAFRLGIVQQAEEENANPLILIVLWRRVRKQAERDNDTQKAEMAKTRLRVLFRTVAKKGV